MKKSRGTSLCPAEKTDQATLRGCQIPADRYRRLGPSRVRFPCERKSREPQFNPGAAGWYNDAENQMQEQQESVQGPGGKIKRKKG